jgi:hypothetical protein
MLGTSQFRICLLVPYVEKRKNIRNYVYQLLRMSVQPGHLHYKNIDCGRLRTFGPKSNEVTEEWRRY